jgi:hypothetical protein
MARDFTEFAGKTPYASELFGVYQPLLGWRSNLNKQRASVEGDRITKEVIRDVANDLRMRPALQLDPRAPYEDGFLSPLVTHAVQASLARFIAQHGAPTLKDWKQIVDSAQFGELARDVAAAGADATFKRVQSLGLTFVNRNNLSARELASRAWHPVEGTELYVAHDFDAATNALTRVQHTLAIETLRTLSTKQPEVLDLAFNRAAARHGWEMKLAFMDPLSSFDAHVQNAYLSPIGVLHLVREYFFEGKSFGGPAVGHVWLSPGSSLELYEVHTRRRLEERRVEVGIESTRKSETSTTEQDDLSNAVSEQNGRNTNLGVTASAGVNFGVVQSSTSANLALGQTRQTSQQTAQKHMRQQSERLASEIRNSVHTAFRTSTEVEDTESRRYLLNNTTNRLINYELKRKMRRVGVQVQSLGAQLCWQVYVDEPGKTLALPELVHIAKPSDLDSVPPPEGPPPLQPKETEMNYDFPWDSQGADPHDPDSQRYDLGRAPSPLPVFFPDLTIGTFRRLDVVPPEEGYELAVVNVVSIDRIDPEKEQPDAVINIVIPERSPKDHFWIVLQEANFQGQPALRLALKLGWLPGETLKADRTRQLNEQTKAYAQEKSRAAHQAYVDAVRERIKLAGEVQRRPSEDLREEERTVIYRQLISKLTAVAPSGTLAQRHVTAELIRALFDVDRMLYFVAPEWWNPRRPHVRQNVLSAPAPANPIVGSGLRNLNLNAAAGSGATAQPPEPILAANAVLGPGNRVDWGGTGGGRETYLVTEDSAPAPLGASLGWILQLDGDAHRNAFLNSPWVKAVVPVRRGREAAAVKWLKQGVEGNEGLAEDAPGLSKTIEAALLDLAKELGEEDEVAARARATDRVFENGFDPLAGGSVAPDPFPVFDQWIEVLPTDQIIAVEYEEHAQ